MASTYTVVSGDYGIKIAQRFVGDGSRWVELKPLNSFVTSRADPRNTGFPVQIGDVLTLPSDWGQATAATEPPVESAALPIAWWAATEDAVDGYSAEAGEWAAPVVGGETLPGEWRVRVQLKPDIEVKKAKGQAGAAITDQGDNPTKVSLRGQLVTREDWERWQALVPVLFAKKSNSERKPLAISHPHTDAFGISVIYVESLEAEDPENDIMPISIDAIEWTPKPPAAKTSGTAKSGSGSSKETVTVVAEQIPPPAGATGAAPKVGSKIPSRQVAR